MENAVLEVALKIATVPTTFRNLANEQPKELKQTFKVSVLADKEALNAQNDESSFS